MALLRTAPGVSRIHASRRVFDILKKHDIQTPVVHHQWCAPAASPHKADLPTQFIGLHLCFAASASPCRQAGSIAVHDGTESASRYAGRQTPRCRMQLDVRHPDLHPQATPSTAEMVVATGTEFGC